MPAPRLTPWENATGVAEAHMAGLVAARYGARLTLAAALIFAVIFWPLYGFWGGVLALLFGRLVALELTSYTLPNVYTLPMMLVGFIVAFSSGQLVATLALWLALMLLAGLGRAWPRARMGVGEGDLKLLAAMAGFFTLPTVLLGVGVGCLAWLPVAFMAPKRPIPLGVPILIGWALILALPGLPESVFGPITAR